MPKANKVEKRDGRTFKVKVCTKLRIGTRKAGKSALLMTKDELLKVLEDKGKKRYHAKAKAALKRKFNTVIE